MAFQYKAPQVKGELAKKDSVIQIITVNFELDQFVLTPEERIHLMESVLKLLKNDPAYYVILNGHADIRGTEEYNMGLSQERANFVKQIMIKEGIQQGRVTTQYFGESQLLKYCPEIKNCDESIHQENRRVEILILKEKRG